MKRFVGFLLCLSAVSFADEITLNLSAPSDREYGVVGDVAPLNWQAPLPMTKVDSNWTLTVNIDEVLGQLNYKYVVLGQQGAEYEPLTGERTLDLSRSRDTQDEWGENKLLSELALSNTQIAEDAEQLQNLVAELQALSPGTLKKEGQASNLVDSLLLSKRYDNWYTAIALYLNESTAGLASLPLSQQNPQIRKALLDGKSKLPFEYEFVGNKMLVTQSPYPKQLPVGAEVLKLNQKFVWQVLELFGNVGKQAQSRLGTDHPWQVGQFDIMLSSLLPPLANGYVVTYQGIKKPKTEYLPAVSWPQRKFNLGQPLTMEEARVSWSRNMQSDNIAYVALDTQPDLALPTKWQDYLSQSLAIFAENKVANLVIDLRQSRSNSLAFYQYLSKLLGFDLTIENDFELVSAKGLEIDVTNSHNEKRPPVIYDFKGMYLLYGANDSEALKHFLLAAKSRGVALLVGEEIAGPKNQFTDAQVPSVVLKHSKFVVQMPNSLYVLRQSESTPTDKIKPDIKLKKSVTDVKKNKDGVLLRLIGKIKNPEI